MLQFETEDVDSDPERQGSSVLAALESLGTELEDFDDAVLDAYADYNEDDIEHSVSEKEKPDPRNTILDPIFKAQPLTIKERLRLRQEALKQSDPMHINIGEHGRGL